MLVTRRGGRFKNVTWEMMSIDLRLTAEGADTRVLMQKNGDMGLQCFNLLHSNPDVCNKNCDLVK